MNVTAIVPAHNEEQTIAEVVRVLVQSSYISDVLVISDGSTDDTAIRARSSGARVYEIPRQGGKGEALLHALVHTQAPILAFFDADLRGLTVEHIEQLVLPVLNGSRAMNVGLRDRGWMLTALTRYLPLISGERVLRRHVIERVPAQYLHGFMVEAALNYFCRAHGLPYGAVPLRGLTIRRKYEKVGWPRAVIQYLRMFSEVARAMVVVRIAHRKGKF